jgi:uncharacterized protein
MRTLWSFGVAFVLALAFVFPASSQERPITIAVYGDSLGDGAWSGLYDILHDKANVHVVRHSKVGSGLTRGDYAQWFADFKKDLDDSKPDVAVVMFGGNDQQSLRDENHKGYIFPTDGWKAVYADRVDAMMSELDSREILTIWVGLPIMRRDDLNKGARILDTIYAAEAERHHIAFLPLVNDFTDASGGFVTHITDDRNRSRQIRADDGVHFTGYGYELIAEKVWAEIQKDRAVTPASTGDR